MFLLRNDLMSREKYSPLRILLPNPSMVTFVKNRLFFGPIMISKAKNMPAMRVAAHAYI